jgi:general secretion pathway protein H
MNRRAPRGLTLIELTVALGIIVVLFAAVVFGVGALTGAKAKEAATELAGTIRALYDDAALSGRTCRLVFELPQERDQEGAVTWRAECAKSGVTAGARRDDELRAANGAGRRRNELDEDDERLRPLTDDRQPTVQELQAREQKRVEEAAKFSSFSSDEVVERQLPSNVTVEVWTQKQRQPVKHGTAYLYFFPQGYTERAQVWVRQGSNTWTVTVSPLTGKTIIHNGELEVPRT